MKLIYLDYNATILIDPEAADAMLPSIHQHFGNPSSSQAFGGATKKAVEEARGQVVSHLEDTQRRRWRDKPAGLGTVSIDHIAMPTANAERLIEFYKRLGFTINDKTEWRAGEANIFSIQIGDSKINVHPERFNADLRGPTAVPGCADICFVWEGTAAECKEWLEGLGVETGGRDRARAPAAAAGCPR